jgi:hypothetical protein
LEGTSNNETIDKKIIFLEKELNDIRNNKGTVTLQVRSIEHLQSWLKKNLASDLLIKPMDVTVD